MSRLLLLQNSNRQLEGMMAISSYVKKNGHQTSILINETESLEEKINEFNPNVVGMTVLSKDHSWAIDTSKEIKEINPDLPVILGGPHPTYYSKILENPHVNSICIGEGEIAMNEVLNSIDYGKNWQAVPSIWSKVGNQILKNELGKRLSAEEIPKVDRDLYKNAKGIRDLNELQIMTSRGCPFSCFFCINYGEKNLYGKTGLRIKSPMRVIEEIEDGRERNDIKTITFQDDIFGVNKRWLNEFSELYNAKVNLPFYSLLRCEIVKTDLVKTLKDMGCFEVGIGVESGNEKIRNEILGKRLETKSIKNAVKILKENNLPFHTFNMFGLPGENLKEAEETLNLNIEINPDIAYTQMFHPYPGTKFFTREAEEKIANANFDLFSTNLPYSDDFKKIQRLQKWSMLTVKYPIIKKVLPLIIRLPFDTLHGNVSKFAWEHIYHQRLKNKK